MPVDKDGSPPVVSIDVKFPQLGQYDVTLWNADGKKPRTVGRGNTTDRIEDTFDLVAKRTDLALLEGHQMVWVIWIQRLSKEAKRSTFSSMWTVTGASPECFATASTMLLSIGPPQITIR